MARTPTNTTMLARNSVTSDSPARRSRSRPMSSLLDGRISAGYRGSVDPNQPVIEDVHAGYARARNGGLGYLSEHDGRHQLVNSAHHLRVDPTACRHVSGLPGVAHQPGHLFVGKAAGVGRPDQLLEIRVRVQPP